MVFHEGVWKRGESASVSRKNYQLEGAKQKICAAGSAEPRCLLIDFSPPRGGFYSMLYEEYQRMNKKIFAALAALALPMTGIAAEEGLKFGASNSNMNYTYVQGAFVDVDFGTGLALEGSYQFHDKFFVFGQFEDVS